MNNPNAAVEIPEIIKSGEGDLVALAEQLRQLESRLTDVLAASRDTILVLDHGSRILLAGGQVEPMFGHSPADLLGEAVSVLLPDRSGAGSDRVEALHKDGHRFRVDLTVSPAASSDRLTMIAVLRDVREGGVETGLAKVRKAETIGRLSGAMAHDFNNLLGVIIGNLDLLSETMGRDAEAEALTREALEAALRGSELARRLMDFAQRPAGRPVLVRANDLLAGVCVRLDAPRGGPIDIKLDVDEAVWPVLADQGELEECLENIVANARDAMPEGGTLTITTANRHLDAEYAATHAGAPMGDFALIEISDTGEGIAPERIAEVFEPFHGTRGPGGGAGLGLTIVQNFARESGGYIDLYSAPGVGTTFRLYLPRAAAVGQPENAADAGASAPTPEIGGSETVLAVDDNAALRRVVVRQLREMGYRTLEAEDGPTALMVLNSEPVDLLFTDVVMPGGISGYDLARLTLGRWPRMKALITTAFPDARLGSDSPQASKLRQLVKPYRKADLARVLREIFDD